MRGPFLALIEAIRQRAHDETERGPTVAGQRGERLYEIELLTEALSAESVCENECRRLAHIAHARQIDWLAQTLEAHADEERRLVERLSRRIRELGGQPPVCNTQAEQLHEVDGDTLSELLDEEFEVETAALTTCAEIAQRLSDADPGSRAVLEEALQVERMHLAALSRLVQH
jgi:bacterioferritin (cytochrome b1)